ncbi:MAG: PAS domain-containing protein [Candidatus Competibacteraceae bacterium]
MSIPSFPSKLARPAAGIAPSQGAPFSNHPPPPGQLAGSGRGNGPPVELDGREYNCALAREMTPRQQPETDLRKSEERLALALSVSGQGLYDINLVTGQAVFSAEYARMLGYEPSSWN